MRFTFLILSLLFIISGLSKAQSIKDERPIPNIEIVSDKLGELLKQSETIRNLNAPFHLSTNFPDLVTSRLYAVLLSMEKEVLVNRSYPVLELRLTPRNSLIQESENVATRLLTADVQLVLTAEDSKLLGSEHVRFTYKDNISMDYFDDLDMAWQGAAFQEKKRIEKRNLWRSVGQPAIIAVATGVTVFLLFNVRSS